MSLNFRDISWTRNSDLTFISLKMVQRLLNWGQDFGECWTFSCDTPPDQPFLITFDLFFGWTGRTFWKKNRFWKLCDHLVANCNKRFSNLFAAPDVILILSISENFLINLFEIWEKWLCFSFNLKIWVFLIWIGILISSLSVYFIPLK